MKNENASFHQAVDEPRTTTPIAMKSNVNNNKDSSTTALIEESKLKRVNELLSVLRHEKESETFL